MAYIRPPGPADDDVIYEADGVQYTWGQHRQMEASLRKLEMDDTMVAEARRRLDAVLLDHGFDPNPPVAELICEHCRRKEYLIHAEDCPDYEKDLAVTREAGSYQFLTDGFIPVHITSVCVNDEEALDYFRIVQVWFYDVNVKYVMRREMHGSEYKMIPWQFDREANAVKPIEVSND